MIKKALHISLVFVLLLGTGGISIYKHYCNGLLISKSIEFPSKNCCNGNCNKCHNEIHTYKISDEYESNPTIIKVNTCVKLLFHNTNLLSSNTFHVLHSNDLASEIFVFKEPDKLPSPFGDQFAWLQIFRL